jgi:hypothetical protein
MPIKIRSVIPTPGHAKVRLSGQLWKDQAGQGQAFNGKIKKIQIKVGLHWVVWSGWVGLGWTMQVRLVRVMLRMGQVRVGSGWVKVRGIVRLVEVILDSVCQVRTGEVLSRSHHVRTGYVKISLRNERKGDIRSQQANSK